MSGENTSAINTSEILKGFADIVAKHSEKTDRALEKTDAALEKMASAVEELTKAHIETKKDREFDSARMERIENTQKEQGIRAKVVSDTVLLLDERVGNQKNKWTEVGKIGGAIVTAVIIAKFLAI